MMAEEGISDYAYAKKKAGRQLGVLDVNCLPSNAEVEEEIKLYNEDEVAEGRARGDLAVRLKDSIERGRRLYEERVPADVRSSRDYYFEELVEVLAGGRPEALG